MQNLHFKEVKAVTARSIVLQFHNYYTYVFVCLFLTRQPPVYQDLLIHEISRSHITDAPQSEGLPRTSDKVVAETST